LTTIKDRLKAGKTVVGTAGSIATDVAVLADAGFDFLIFDTQHTPVEIKQLKPGLDAVRGKKATPIVRVSDNRPDLICFALDLGARGIVVPMVNTKAEATAIVRACRYSPLGDRSNAGVRGEWGEHRNYRDYMDHVNSELLIIPMIETKRAVEAIDDILSVDGIDVLLVGPSDLSIELDVPLEYESPKYQRSLDKIANACRKRGVVAGMYFIPPKIDPNFFVEKGFRFFTLPWAPWATEGIQKGLGGINGR